MYEIITFGFKKEKPGIKMYVSRETVHTKDFQLESFQSFSPQTIIADSQMECFFVLDDYEILWLKSSSRKATSIKLNQARKKNQWGKRVQNIYIIGAPRDVQFPTLGLSYSSATK